MRVGRGNLTLRECRIIATTASVLLLVGVAGAQQPAYIQSLTQFADTICPTNGQSWRRVGAGSGYECFTPAAATADITGVGDCSAGECFNASGTGNSLVFEGTTADTIEGTLVGADFSTSDKTITLPNETGTVALIQAQSDNSTACTSCTGSDIDATGLNYIDLTAAFSAHEIHGIAGGYDGKVLKIMATGALSTIKLMHQSTTDGTAGNRLVLPGNTNTYIQAGLPAMLVYDGGASRWKYLLGSEVQEVCYKHDDVDATDDNVEFWISPATGTFLLAVACRCSGTCTPTLATFALENDAAGAITGSPTCATAGNLATWTVTSTTAMAQGRGLRFDVTNTPNPATDEYVICVQYFGPGG